MAQHLRALGDLSEDPVLIPSTQLDGSQMSATPVAEDQTCFSVLFR